MKASSAVLTSGVLLASVAGAAFYANNYVVPRKIGDAVQSEVDKNLASAGTDARVQPGAVEVTPTGILTYKIVVPAMTIARETPEGAATLTAPAQTYDAKMGGSLAAFAHAIVKGDRITTQMQSSAPVTAHMDYNDTGAANPSKTTMDLQCTDVNVSFAPASENMTLGDCMLSVTSDNVASLTVQGQTQARAGGKVIAHFSGMAQSTHGAQSESIGDISVDSIAMTLDDGSTFKLTGDIELSSWINREAASSADPARRDALADVAKALNLPAAADRPADEAFSVILPIAVDNLNLSVVSADPAHQPELPDLKGVSGEIIVSADGRNADDIGMSVSVNMLDKDGALGPAGDMSCHFRLGHIPADTLSRYFSAAAAAGGGKIELQGAEQITSFALPLAHIADAAQMYSIAKCHVHGLGVPGNADLKNAFRLSGGAVTASGGLKLDGVTPDQLQQILSLLPDRYGPYASMAGAFMQPTADNKGAAMEYKLTPDGQLKVNGMPLGQIPKLPPMTAPMTAPM